MAYAGSQRIFSHEYWTSSTMKQAGINNLEDTAQKTGFQSEDSLKQKVLRAGVETKIWQKWATLTATKIENTKICPQKRYIFEKNGI